LERKSCLDLDEFDFVGFAGFVGFVGFELGVNCGGVVKNDFYYWSSRLK